MDANCKVCGKEFNRTSNNMWCSDGCKRIDAKKDGRMYQSKENVKRRNAKYSEKNAEKLRMIKLSYRMRLKVEVLSHYSCGNSPKCVRCGESDPDILVLDHINDDGAKHRKELNIASRDSNGGVIRGQRSYEAYKKAGYPEGLQVLCASCNTKKQMVKNRKKHMENPFYEQYIKEERRLAWISEW